MTIRNSGIAIASVLLTVWLSASVTAATSPDDFVLKSTEDFVNVCQTSPEEDLYTAAIHFCHGYAVGTFQYYQTLAAQGGGELVCLPDPRPTRSEALDQFMTWTKSHPQYMSQPAAETIMRFLIEKYGCK